MSELVNLPVGEIRRTEESFLDQVQTFAAVLEHDGIAHVTYAAERTSHKLLAIDAKHISGRCVGAVPQGVGDLEANTHTLWVCDSWTKGSAWLARGSYHDPGYLGEGDHALYRGGSRVDLVALAEFVNRVELARGARWGGWDVEAMFAEHRASVAKVSDDFPGPVAA